MSFFIRNCRLSLPQDTWGYLLILIVVIVAALIRDINLLIILAGLMLGPLLFSWQVVRTTLSRLQCRRRLPDAVYPGELITVEVTVSNPRTRLDSWGLLVRDRYRFVSASRNGSQPGREVCAQAFVPHVRAGDSQTTVYRGRLYERGRYEVGPLEISTRVPVGLIRGTITVPKSVDYLLVYPRLGTVQSRWKELVKVERIGQGSSRRSQGQIEGDFFGLRDWRTGDSQRWIHWRSSAKRNSLVVRQFEQSRNQNFVLLLDLCTTNQAAAELAISFAATVVVEHCRRGGGNLVLGVGGFQVRFVRGFASNAVVHEALEVLAEAETTSDDRMPEILDKGMNSVAADDRVFIVATTPLDLRDTTRFAAIWRDRQKRNVLSKAICIDVTGHSFGDFFSFDDAANGGARSPIGHSLPGQPDAGPTHGNRSPAEAIEVGR
jgi:uncharacterized protein (DUF58 family)